MWGKWIGCDVPEGMREGFSAAQGGWSAIGDQPGLVGQVGGWDPRTGHARVLGLWTDADTYARFMRDRHDTVVAGLRQGETYSGIDIAAGETVLDLDGDLPGGLAAAGLLRVADCRLFPGREEHFLEVQRTVWGPGMAASGGLLAGTVTRLDPARYLVTTLWTGPDAHRHYTEAHLPALHTRARVQDDAQSITGHALPLEPSWRILPTSPSR
ncbi:DUF4937 domain-containing protein [Streptomyces sp. NPDC059564]|uniref:DUF4937 domain-containing protein n=1 Tax=Streptomyces sp. NPDC059564 TaxID=3346865 RepID=UPI0036BBDB86